MHIDSQLIKPTHNIAVQREVSRTAPALMAAALGLVLLFVAGFAESNVLHSATHDTRHSTGFPCH